MRTRGHKPCFVQQTLSDILLATKHHLAVVSECDTECDLIAHARRALFSQNCGMRVQQPPPPTTLTGRPQCNPFLAITIEATWPVQTCSPIGSCSSNQAT